MSAIQSATSSPIAYAASDATQVPPILNDVNADAFDLDRALDSILSEEVPLSGDASDFNDTEMDEASVAMATPSLADNCTPVQGIEKNVAILKGRIYELSTMIIQHGQVVPSSLITELTLWRNLWYHIGRCYHKFRHSVRSLRSSLEELIEVQRLMTPVITPPTLWPDKVVFYTNNSRSVSKYAHCKFGNYEIVWLLNLVSMYTGFIMQYIFH
ncbi:hypothetical protein BDF21DRAFT_495433 [Thamnidium elegans]|nr:hypothetical protein BDF21DRAFT_495433 [Thamnidium elegans]